MFFKGAQRKVNRLKKDIFTEKGANRNHLAREIYDFINAHGGLCSIKITLTEDRTIEETYKHYYFGDGSVFPLRNDRSASYVSVWDRNNREHRFNFNEHGYMNPDAECVYDLIMRLKDLLHTSHFNFYGQWEARLRLQHYRRHKFRHRSLRNHCRKRQRLVHHGQRIHIG